jgi:hypothetical protein
MEVFIDFVLAAVIEVVTALVASYVTTRLARSGQLRARLGAAA